MLGPVGVIAFLTVLLLSDQEQLESEQEIQEQEYHQKRAAGSQDSSDEQA